MEQADGMKRRATIKDVAQRVGVAVSTVSAVLNDRPYCYLSEVRRREILAAAKRLGYIPNRMARGMRGMPTRTVGVLAGMYNIPVHSALLREVSRLLADAGYAVLFGDSTGPERDRLLLREFLAHGVDAVLIGGGELEPDELDRLLGRHLPYVALDPCFDRHTVAVDRERAMYMAVEHLVTDGRCRRVALVGEKNPTAQLKLAGYRRAMRDHGLSPERGLCVWDGSRARKLAALQRLAGRGVDGVACCSDLAALELLALAPELRIRVPRDWRLTGFDGIDWLTNLSRPRLTTLRQPVEKVAAAAVDRLIRLLGGESCDPAPVFIEPCLSIGESSRYVSSSKRQPK